MSVIRITARPNGSLVSSLSNDAPSTLCLHGVSSATKCVLCSSTFVCDHIQSSSFNAIDKVLYLYYRSSDDTISQGALIWVELKLMSNADNQPQDQIESRRTTSQRVIDMGRVQRHHGSMDGRVPCVSWIKRRTIGAGSFAGTEARHSLSQIVSTQIYIQYNNISTIYIHFFVCHANWIELDCLWFTNVLPLVHWRVVPLSREVAFRMATSSWEVKPGHGLGFLTLGILFKKYLQTLDLQKRQETTCRASLNVFRRN